MSNVSLRSITSVVAIVSICLTSVADQAYGCTTPSGLSTTSITSTGAQLNWGTVSGAISYKVRYRKTGTTTWTSYTVTQNTKTISGLVPATTYEWKVLTNCSGSTSSYSSVLAFSTNCGAPAGLSTTNITATSAQLNWSATPCDSFMVRYYATSVPNTIYYKTVTPSTATSTTLTGLQQGTNYSWLIRTYCSGGQGGAYSSTVTFSTTGSCNTPAGLTSSSVTTTSATLSWNAVTGAGSYNIQYRITGTSTWTAATSTSTSKSISGLTPGSNYEFQVQTLCTAGGNSSWSASAAFTTLSSCNAPGGLSSSSITTSGATLSWSAATGALSYNMHYRISGGSSWTSTTSSTTSKSLTGLSPATTYEFQVQTVCSSGSSAWSVSANFTTANSLTLPVPDHVVVLIEENHGYSQIIGSSSAPYINALAVDPMSTLFTQMYGIEHPSQPNYIDLFSGGNQGITNNNVPASHFTTANLARELINAGKTFKSYAQTMPSAGYDGASSGKYVRKHNPITNWMGTGTNQVSSTLNQPFTAFPADYTTLPTVSFVIPDLDYDMHDGSIATGDTWFHNNLDGYVQWAKTHNSLFILVFDEDDGNYNNRIAMIFTGAMVKSGTVSTTYNHYNLLRTIEDMYGTTHAGNAASASAIHGCWLNGYRESGNDLATAQDFQWDVFPNPAADVINVSFESTGNTAPQLSVYDNMGQKVTDVEMPGDEHATQKVSLSTRAVGMSKGIYFLEMVVDGRKYVKKIAVLE